MKGTKVILLLGFISLILMGFVNSDYMSIESSSTCANPVMGLFSATNAHGELASEGNYNYVLCANYSGYSTCDAGNTNKIIGLFSDTNAHAEIPSSITYPTDVCYEGVSCVARTSCDAGEEAVLSLYDDTNSHLGEPGDYSTQICCSFDGNVVPPTNCSVAGGDDCEGDADCYEGQTCDLNSCTCKAIPGECQFNTGNWSTLGPVYDGDLVSMDFTFNGNCVGHHLSFEIYEVDGMWLPDDLISPNPESVLISGSAATQTWIAIWEEESHFDDPGTGDDREYRFIATIEENRNTWNRGDELKVLDTIVIPPEDCLAHNICGDYTNQSYCVADPCHVGNSSEILEDCINIGNCRWNNVTLTCAKVIEPNCNGPGNIGSIPIGTCTYNEDTDDDCLDGYLTYNWTANWNWAVENKFYSNLGEGFIEEPAKIWRYDPNNDFADCVNGSNLLSCPASIELSFFSWINVLIIILVIILVYYFFGKKKSNNKSKKK
jgi:hypothetical protein